MRDLIKCRSDGVVFGDFSENPDNCSNEKAKVINQTIFTYYQNRKFFFLMRRRPPRSTQGVSSAASDVYKRQGLEGLPEKKEPKMSEGLDRLARLPRQ